jgi:hypothetical protein
MEWITNTTKTIAQSLHHRDVVRYVKRVVLKKAIDFVEYSPNGACLAVVVQSYPSAIAVYDTTNWTMIEWIACQGKVSSLAWHPWEDAFLVAASTVRCWDASPLSTL